MSVSAKRSSWCRYRCSGLCRFPKDLELGTYPWGREDASSEEGAVAGVEPVEVTLATRRLVGWASTGNRSRCSPTQAVPCALSLQTSG